MKDEQIEEYTFYDFKFLALVLLHLGHLLLIVCYGHFFLCIPPPLIATWTLLWRMGESLCGVKRMNDYSQGALEALAWVSSLLDSDRELAAVFEEINSAKNALLSGIGVDFRRKLRD